MNHITAIEDPSRRSRVLGGDVERSQDCIASTPKGAAMEIEAHSRETSPFPTLNTVVRINFFSGLVGSLLLVPFAYIYEIATSGTGSVGPVGLQVFMVLVWALITAVAVVAMGLLAYPVMRLAHKRGLVKF